MTRLRDAFKAWKEKLSCERVSLDETCRLHFLMGNFLLSNRPILRSLHNLKVANGLHLTEAGQSCYKNNIKVSHFCSTDFFAGLCVMLRDEWLHLYSVCTPDATRLDWRVTSREWWTLVMGVVQYHQLNEKVRCTTFPFLISHFHFNCNLQFAINNREWHS